MRVVLGFCSLGVRCLCVDNLLSARQALALVHTLADDFAAEIAQLSATPVSRCHRTAPGQARP